ncbi:divisome protein SepX/GlpR [Corynebacterium uberis]|uniref:divisome protein SepX/GlpR n=1 Tax=Corynebacterium TaxID=1716 RepID=UPI001D0A5416|nr:MULTISPECIES: gephyrin-like molybdotransferase receptor GlpR [Corynebacterium]MCZ9308782.1 hypothetical protein [Corynebacterium sp. c6VSa_13]UDL72689.1 hypothetical protein LH391_06025 [Corynebacterium uberis]UDL76435.1 hypothetical protein LH393_03380 [Corynebacterium uberis]UDL78647.1 hypothetical protein LH394_03365 [Corynebacterium uberis]UDL80926.1 hypothetical protein LH392_03790 [Corynebacterium uberis]
MNSGLLIAVIAVLWLFVLAPLIQGARKPVSRAGDAFDETRVVYQGGTDIPASRRRPRLRPSDVRPALQDDEDEEDYELVDAADIIVDEDAPAASGRVKGTAVALRGYLSARLHHHEEQAADAHDADTVEGEVVGGSHALSRADLDHAEESASLDEAPEQEPLTETDNAVDETDEVQAQPFEHDDSYTDPQDLLYGAPADAAGPADPADQAGATAAQLAPDAAAEEESTTAAEARLSTADLTAEDYEFAAARRGRGSWDPEADARVATTRYQRRQRALLILAGAVALAVAAGFIWGGWAWSATVITGALLVSYLVALRRQVQQEEQLRRRRIQHLRRARLGVRHRDDDALHIPRQLRRPGAVVLELDDASPDFHHLRTVTRPVADRDRTSRHLDYDTRVAG